jgi:hypothetical protein
MQQARRKYGIVKRGRVAFKLNGNLRNVYWQMRRLGADKVVDRRTGRTVFVATRRAA